MTIGKLIGMVAAQVAVALLLPPQLGVWKTVVVLFLVGAAYQMLAPEEARTR